MPTYGWDDIDAGRPVLWPAKEIEVRKVSWADEGEYRYPIEGEERWVGADDCNSYGTAVDEVTARRLIACWNIFIGVPLVVLEETAAAVVRAQRDWD